MKLSYPPYPAPLLPRPTAVNPSPTLVPGVEMFPVVDPTGMVIGQMTRAYAHGGARLLHPVVHLHVLDRQGRLYLQQRSFEKDLLPGYWDTAVGGHVSYGEQIDEALFREAAEELGLRDFNPTLLDTYVFEGIQEKELVSVFACVGAYEPKPDGTEVIGGRFWTFKEIEDNLGKSVLTPNFEGEFARIREALESLL
ncbi:MAG: NUDIX domain-containing protein [Bacteroidales bacterium]|nr:NUDIX domain-containing protein [Bacteroidales bacterium]